MSNIGVFAMCTNIDKCKEFDFAMKILVIGLHLFHTDTNFFCLCDSDFLSSV